jgi:tetratricopeptide (TPR) repeat protein
LVEYDLQEAFARSPSLLCRLLSIARHAMLVRGDFATFAPYIERCYRLMERRHGFAPAQRGYQLRLLYMLAHALYRARRFAESVAYLEQGRALLAAAPGRQFAEMGSRFTFLLAANYAFLNRNQESISLLLAALKAKPALLPAEQLTARLQLTFHYFAEGQFAKANQTLISLDRTDHWLEQNMGLEWLLNHNIGEVLIQLELGNSEQALVRLRAIERRLHEQFPACPATADAPPTPLGGPYHAVLCYLALVHELLDKPAVAGQADFANRVVTIPAFLSEEREDLQVISFYAWLRARSQGRPYYEVLLRLAGG